MTDALSSAVTVVLTVVLSVLVCAYVLVLLIRMKPRETDKLFDALKT